jgi:hypothetical protein
MLAKDRELKLLLSPIESTRWVWEHAPLAFRVPRQMGGKRETLNELQSANHHRIHRQERRD